MEDALKRLDRLTQEEVRMAAAEILKLTHIIVNGTSGVEYTVPFILNVQTRVDIQQLANSVDDVKCSW